MNLRALLTPELVEALESLIDERVQSALTTHDAGNGASPWLTLEQAAERLHVSQRTVERWVKSERLNVSYVGRRALVDARDLDEAMRRT